MTDLTKIVQKLRDELIRTSKNKVQKDNENYK